MAYPLFIAAHMGSDHAKFCMKTYKNLFPEITSFANLELAWRKARKGKRSKQAAASYE